MELHGFRGLYIVRLEGIRNEYVYFRHPCHTWDLGLRTWDPCEVVSPNLHALNG